MEIGDTLLLKLNRCQSQCNQYFIVKPLSTSSSIVKRHTLDIKNSKNEYVGRLSSVVEKPISKILLVETYFKVKK